MDATNSSLYHYTSGDGLIGILRNKSLWATDINFLNDHREFELGSKLIGDLSKVKVQELIKKNVADSLEVREKLLGDLESFTTSLHSLTSGFNHNTISFTSKFDCLIFVAISLFINLVSNLIESYFLRAYVKSIYQ